MSKTLGILGCGWLGFRLAQSFLAIGYTVKGSTTTADKTETLSHSGIIPFLLRLTEERIEGDIIDFLKDLEILIINVPPKLRAKDSEDYLKKMGGLHRAIKASSVKKIIFVSSTSVYGDLEGEVTEQSVPHPATASGKQLLDAEQLFQNDRDLVVTIIRFGGLIGPDRHPVTFLSGKQLSNGDDLVNLVHIDDCIAIIQAIVKGGWWNATFNGVYPLHPKKKDYYPEEARKKGLQPPRYGGGGHGTRKAVKSYHLISVKKYRFATTIVG